MNIRETFLSLTSKTYPYGYEDELESFIPKGYSKDEHGNYYVKIGNSRVAFSCHLDTMCKNQVDVNHKIDGHIIRTDGKSILGADDKAGMTVILYMIEKQIPGLYCFFIGEECGCIGSGEASRNKSFADYDKMISFDRRGTGSVITYQSSRRCCSDDFANALSKELNNQGMVMSPDDTGVYTDSAEFTSIIPECTNISVGYNKEHTTDEHQDIAHLIKLCQAVIKVDWEKLPTKRNPKETEYKKYSNVGYHAGLYNKYDLSGEFGDYNQYNESKRRRTRRSRNYNRYEDGWDKSPSKGIFSENKFIKSNLINEANNKKGKVYYNDLDNEIDESWVKSKMYYETLKQIIYDDKITAREFETLKDQYLDMSNPGDREFAEEMLSLL
jgi:hypothetical protein